MQIGFEYNYKDSSDILSAIQSIEKFSEFEFAILGVIIVFIGIGVYYLFPLVYLMKKYFDRQKEKAKRKLMLKQISMQKDIEDEIEAEIEVTAQAQEEAQKK